MVPHKRIQIQPKQLIVSFGLQTINSILFFENVIQCAVQLPRSVHGRWVRHIMRIASHCVLMDGSCAYNRNPPFPSLCTPCHGSPRHAVFTLTSTVVKFADDYAFFLSPFLDLPVRQDPRNDIHLQVLNVLRCWFQEYRYRTQRYQCHRYSATLLRRFVGTILRLVETLKKMCKSK